MPEALHFRPKPQIQGFLRLLRKERLTASRCIMVEDSAENLRTAKSLGMRTVLVAGMGNADSNARRPPAWVDLRIKSVLELPRRIDRLA